MFYFFFFGRTASLSFSPIFLFFVLAFTLLILGLGLAAKISFFNTECSCLLFDVFPFVGFFMFALGFVPLFRGFIMALSLRGFFSLRGFSR